jgi:hypothetical protein
MNARQQTVIARALSFPMGNVLERYAADHLASLEEAERLERELKRYLILCALNPGKRYGMGGPVDDLWHTFLLFTQSYAAFCDRVAGRFIHHAPADPAAPGDFRRWQDDYATFWHDYAAVFGEPPPGAIWPDIALVGQEGPEPV